MTDELIRQFTPELEVRSAAQGGDGRPRRRQRAVGAVRQQQLGARGTAGLRLFDRPAVEEFGRALLRVAQVALRLERSGEADRRRLGAGVDELWDRVLGFEHDAGGLGRDRPHHLILQVGDLLRRQRIGIVGANERPQRVAMIDGEDAKAALVVGEVIEHGRKVVHVRAVPWGAPSRTCPSPLRSRCRHRGSTVG